MMYYQTHGGYSKKSRTKPGHRCAIKLAKVLQSGLEHLPLNQLNRGDADLDSEKNFACFVRYTLGGIEAHPGIGKGIKNIKRDLCIIQNVGRIEIKSVPIAAKMSFLTS